MDNNSAGVRNKGRDNVRKQCFVACDGLRSVELKENAEPHRLFDGFVSADQVNGSFFLHKFPALRLSQQHDGIVALSTIAKDRIPRNIFMVLSGWSEPLNLSLFIGDLQRP